MWNLRSRNLDGSLNKSIDLEKYHEAINNEKIIFSIQDPSN
jgi:hypothetical protein